MKKSIRIIFGAIVIALGLLIALGPQFLFPVCGAMPDEEAADCCAAPEESGCCDTGSSYSICYWSARAEIGVGLLIAVLGICIIVLKDPKIQLGLAIGTFLSGFVALFIPHSLIQGCDSADMLCQKIGFPALTVESIILLVVSAVIVLFPEIKKPQA